MCPVIRDGVDGGVLSDFSMMCGMRITTSNVIM